MFWEGWGQHFDGKLMRVDSGEWRFPTLSHCFNRGFLMFGMSVRALLYPKRCSLYLQHLSWGTFKYSNNRCHFVSHSRPSHIHIKSPLESTWMHIRRCFHCWLSKVAWCRWSRSSFSIPKKSRPSQRRLRQRNLGRDRGPDRHQNSVLEEIGAWQGATFLVINRVECCVLRFRCTCLRKS